MKNKYCDSNNFHNESDVEQFFIIPLLKDLGFTDDYIRTKKSIFEFEIDKGKKRRLYKPDYILYLDKKQTKPIILIDAKHPYENPEEGVIDSQMYTSVLRRKLKPPKYEQYCIGTNGSNLIIKHFESDEVELELGFNDFQNDNVKYKQLLARFNYVSLKERLKSIEKDVSEKFEYKKPKIEKIESIFVKCNNAIWKREKIDQTKSFYEFSKIMFLKMKMDEKLRENESIKLKIENEEPLDKKDVIFSVHWIEQGEKVDTNPFDTTLFKNLRNELESKIKKGEKKRIFTSNERIDLKPSTIKEVVRILEHYDLHGIDEDLNGRLFEIFLNVIIRGRSLGQYFTPRKVVNFMTQLADLEINKDHIDRVLDACCGTGGFLIEAMAIMSKKVDALTNLSGDEQEELKKRLKNEYLYGIDVSAMISRIARINMYLHGDGGSRIYQLDSLDREMFIEEGIDDELKDDMLELKRELIDQNLKFNIVLTNPPFSMEYSKKEDDERRILEQYIGLGDEIGISNKPKTTQLKPSVKSNVLFLARYHDFLISEGKMIIVIDDSVLNSYTHTDYREFIREKYIIKAIFSLPSHTFVKAGAGGTTSILYLQKKRRKGEKQGVIFARVIENVGHSKSGKPIGKNDFYDVLKEFKIFEKTGVLMWKGEKEIGGYENDNLFLIDPKMIDDRLDINFYKPSYRKFLDKLREIEKRDIIELKKLSEFESMEKINYPGKKFEFFKYVEISTTKGGWIDKDEIQGDTLENLPNRARMVIKTNDVLFSKPFRSLKKVVMVPKELNDQLASTGFVVLKTKDYDEACLLWSIFRSKLIQKQFLHICSGFTQREMSDEYLNKYLLIPTPKKNKENLIKKIKENIETYITATKGEEEATSNIIDMPLKEILS